jgi:hypothetical protein
MDALLASTFERTIASPPGPLGPRAHARDVRRRSIVWLTKGSEMTFREATEINTRLQDGSWVTADERLALAEFLVDRIDAGDADVRELIAMLFMADRVRPELDRLWWQHEHRGRAGMGV